MHLSNQQTRELCTALKVIQGDGAADMVVKHAKLLCKQRDDWRARFKKLEKHGNLIVTRTETIEYSS